MCKKQFESRAYVKAEQGSNCGAANSGRSRRLSSGGKTRHASKEPPRKAAAGKIARPTRLPHFAPMGAIFSSRILNRRFLAAPNPG
jgi:hypothetical protein